MSTQQYKVYFSAVYYQAWDEISSWLKREVSAYVAARLLEVIQQQISMVAVMPYMFAAYPVNPAFRKMIIPNWSYVIFYRVDEDKKQIGIHRIYHTAQNYQEDMTAEAQPS